MRIFLIPLLLYLLLSCSTQTLDTEYINSSQANSPEFPVLINNKICKDIEGKPGLCATRVPSHKEIQIRLPIYPVHFQLHLYCSKDLGIDFSIDILAKQQYTYPIPPEVFKELRSFTCIGEIFPSDRNLVSSKFEIRFVVVDQNYSERETINFFKKGDRYYLNFGQNAYYSFIYYFLKDKVYLVQTKDQIVELKTLHFIALSESYQMRYNYIENL